MDVYSTRPLKAEIRGLSKTRCEFICHNAGKTFGVQVLKYITRFETAFLIWTFDRVSLLLDRVYQRSRGFSGVNVSWKKNWVAASTLNLGSRLAERPRSYQWLKHKTRWCISLMTIPIFLPSLFPIRNRKLMRLWCKFPHRGINVYGPKLNAMYQERMSSLECINEEIRKGVTDLHVSPFPRRA